MKMIFESVEHRNRRSHHYKIQPENQGKTIFISAPPVLGNAMFVTAQNLAQKEGFVYYDGDLLAGFRNPYMPENAEVPSCLSNQPMVRGWSKEDLMTFPGLKQLMIDMPSGNIANQKSALPFFKMMAKDFVSEKKKIGGDWVITSSFMPTRKMRDFMKNESNATFVVFTLSEESQIKTVGKLNPTASYIDWTKSVHKCYQTVEPDEKDAHELVITLEMEEDDIVKHVIDLINKVEVSKPSEVDHHLPPLPIRQPRESRLPKIQPTYLPSLVDARVPSGRSVVAEMSYTV